MKHEEVLERPATQALLTATPASLTFPSQGVGTRSAPKTIEISSHSLFTIRGILIIGGIETSNGAPAEFVSAPPSGTATVVVDRGKATITVWFLPAQAGPRTATLMIYHDNTPFPLAIPLSGTGVVSVNLPRISISPTYLFFDPKKLTNHKVTITNTGTAPLIISSITLTSPNFTFTPTTNLAPAGGTLNPNQTGTITVLCNFIGPGGSAELVIKHNAAGGSISVTLDATNKDGVWP